MTEPAMPGAPRLRILTLQNHDRSPSGLIGEAIVAAGGTEEVVLPHRGEAVPETPEGYDALLILGGTQSAADDDAHPYLPAERRAIRAFAAGGRPVMGVCLGAQLVARAFGAEVRRHHTPEIGFTAIEALPPAGSHPLFTGLTPVPPLMQWHYDTFDLPAGAALLAANEVCAHQAFALGPDVVGLQFHLEVTEAIVRGWLREFTATASGPLPGFVAEAEDQLAACLPAAADFTARLSRRWMTQIADRAARRAAGQPVPA